MRTSDGRKVGALILIGFCLNILIGVSLKNHLHRIEATQQELIKNQIQIIENLAAINQDSFHSNE